MNAGAPVVGVMPPDFPDYAAKSGWVSQPSVRIARLSGQSSCPRGVNLFGMWRVQRLDQINAFNPANLFDFKSLALKIRKKQIGRFKTVIRPLVASTSAATIEGEG